MPYQDFRQFLDVLRQGELIDVDRPIALTDVGKALLAFQSDEKMDRAKGARQSRESDRASDD